MFIYFVYYCYSFFFRDDFVLHKIEALEKEPREVKETAEHQRRLANLVEEQLDLQVNAVIPGSADFVTDDSEFALYRVVIFRAAKQSFELDCNSKSQTRIIVREYTFKDGQSAADSAEVSKLTTEETASKAGLKRWSITAFSEAYRAWIHLKAIRLRRVSAALWSAP